MRWWEWMAILTLLLVALVLSALEPGSWTHAILTGQKCYYTFGSTKFSRPPICNSDPE
jgi:hypothetical protein